MATRKAGGTAKNLRDSQPKFLGVKIGDGGKASPGSVIVRQRGSKILPGKNVRMGRDHTIYATTDGKVHFGETSKMHFDGTKMRKKVVSVK